MYFLVDAESLAFKVGVSANPIKRVLSLPEKIDFGKSLQFSCERSDVFRAEKTIHFLFSSDRFVKPAGDGYTEWFAIDAFEKIFDFVVGNQDKFKWMSYGPIHDPAQSTLPPVFPAQPTGNPWEPTPENPATVPIPASLITIGLETNFTEHDRKLYAFLIHAVWGELEEKRVHKLKLARINKVFRDHGGENNPGWIWDSAKRLAEIPIAQDKIEGEDRLQGVANLLSYAATHEEARADGYLKFEFPAGLIPVLKEPRRFARLRIHFLLGLSGKYAVTLYEILESVVNMRNPVLEVEIGKLRQWLKVPKGKLDRYVDFKRFVLEPGIRQINESPEGAGFSVRMESLKQSRSVTRIRFIVTKTDGRINMESVLNSPAVSLPQAKQETPTVTGGFSPLLNTKAYEKAKKAAPGLDVYFLEQEWREWMRNKPLPNDPEAAFVGFCRKRYKNLGQAA